MERSLISLVLCAAVLAGGCHVDSAPQTINRFGTAGRDAVIRTPYKGDFVLYKMPDKATDGPESAGVSIATIHLEKGQWLGFKRDEHGTAVAVAGDHPIPIQDGKYEWVMKADPGQIDPVKTTLFVAGMIVLVVVVTLGVVAAINIADFYGGWH